MADLKPNEVEKAKLHFGIYDMTGAGKVDAFYLGDLIRSLDLRPSQATILKAGGSEKKGEKALTLDEFLPVYSQLKKDKDVGAFEDLLEGMKLYDKQENGTMMAAELSHVMLSLGERLTDAEVDEIAAACVGEPDDEGFIRYEDFLKKLFAGPFPESAQ